MYTSVYLLGKIPWYIRWYVHKRNCRPTANNVYVPQQGNAWNIQLAHIRTVLHAITLIIKQAMCKYFGLGRMSFDLIAWTWYIHILRQIGALFENHVKRQGVLRPYMKGNVILSHKYWLKNIRSIWYAIKIYCHI